MRADMAQGAALEPLVKKARRPLASRCPCPTHGAHDARGRVFWRESLRTPSGLLSLRRSIASQSARRSISASHAAGPRARHGRQRPHRWGGSPARARRPCRARGNTASAQTPAKITTPACWCDKAVLCRSFLYRTRDTQVWVTVRDELWRSVRLTMPFLRRRMALRLHRFAHPVYSPDAGLLTAPRQHHHRDCASTSGSPNRGLEDLPCLSRRRRAHPGDWRWGRTRVRAPCAISPNSCRPRSRGRCRAVGATAHRRRRVRRQRG